MTRTDRDLTKLFHETFDLMQPTTQLLQRVSDLQAFQTSRPNPTSAVPFRAPARRRQLAGAVPAMAVAAIVAAITVTAITVSVNNRSVHTAAASGTHSASLNSVGAVLDVPLSRPIADTTPDVVQQPLPGLTNVACGQSVDPEQPGVDLQSLQVRIPPVIKANETIVLNPTFVNNGATPATLIVEPSWQLRIFLGGRLVSLAVDVRMVSVVYEKPLTVSPEGSTRLPGLTITNLRTCDSSAQLPPGSYEVYLVENIGTYGYAAAGPSTLTVT